MEMVLAVRRNRWEEHHYELGELVVVGGGVVATKEVERVVVGEAGHRIAAVGKSVEVEERKKVDKGRKKVVQKKSS